MSEHIQASLDSLRNTRTALYQIPEAVTSRMSLQDQTKYGDNLHRVSLLIMRLESTTTSTINSAFTQQESQFRSIVEKMESTMESDMTTLYMIRTVNNALRIADNIIELLH